MPRNRTPQNPWASYLEHATARPGWSVTRLIEESGVSKAQLYRWLAGDVTDVKLSSLMNIADALDDRPGVLYVLAQILNVADEDILRGAEEATVWELPESRPVRKSMIQRLRELKRHAS